MTIPKLIKIAEKQDWNVTKEDFCNDGEGYSFRKYSDAGQDFGFSIESKKDGKQSPETLLMNLEDYIENFEPASEALLWVDSDGHGINGAPHELEDVIADMKQCREMMRELLSAWKAAMNGKKETEKKTFTIYRTVRIDGEYDPSRTSLEEALDTAVNKVINDARAHTHTIEEGVRICDIEDCGENE